MFFCIKMYVTTGGTYLCVLYGHDRELCFWPLGRPGWPALSSESLVFAICRAGHNHKLWRPVRATGRAEDDFNCIRTYALSPDDDRVSEIVQHAVAPEFVWLLLPLLHNPTGKLLVQRLHILPRPVVTLCENSAGTAWFNTVHNSVLKIASTTARVHWEDH